MNTLAPAKTVASVSLTESDRDPDAFAAGARPLVRALRLRDHLRSRHSGRSDPPRRGEGQGLLRAARGGEAQISPEGRRRRARLHAVRHRDRQGRGQLRPQGILARRAASCRRATNIATRWRPTSGPRRSQSFQATPSSSCSRRSTRPACKILEAIARYLGLAPDYFEDTVKDGNSILRLLHYPPIPGDGPNVRAGAHEDINTITLLLGAEEAGLQLLDRDGDWLPVDAASRASSRSISATCCSG